MECSGLQRTSLRKAALHRQAPGYHQGRDGSGGKQLRANWRRPTYAGRWVGWMVRTLVDRHQPIGYSPLLCQLDKIDRRSTENS